MSRVQRFAIAGAFWAVAYVVHALAIRLFGPESLLREMNAGASVGDATAASVNPLIYKITAVWVPLGLVGFVVVWLVLMEYRTQTVGDYYLRR